MKDSLECVSFIFIPSTLHNFDLAHSRCFDYDFFIEKDDIGERDIKLRENF